MAGFWATPPVGRVVHLAGASPAAIALSLEPLPSDAPAVVTCYPRAEVSPSATVAATLDELEHAATVLFPAWLPGAEGLDGPQGARVAAVRALATRKGATTPQFGPFLADLAERSLGSAPAGNGRLAAEVRAAGLARVLADSFARRWSALLVYPPDGLLPAAAHTLVAACEWLAHHGGFGVWLVGAELSTVDRVPVVTVQMPQHVAILAQPPDATPAPEGTAVSFPPLAGRPHPGSPTERALEEALGAQPWAWGRAWNQTYQADVLTNPIRVDLLWKQERCAVEIDGPEHHSGLQYEADRRRDMELQLAGFAVLRFTNAQVAHDLGTVLAHLEQIVTTRRRGRDDHGR